MFSQWGHACSDDVFFCPLPLASQNNYRIDANQELLAIGKPPVAALCGRVCFSVSRLSCAGHRDGRGEVQGAEVALSWAL